jgi:DNA (cytosine-5)-methyltransferase 1
MSAYYNEHDPFAAAWLRELIVAGELPAGFVDERDIKDVQPEDLGGYTQCHFFAGIGGWPYALRLAGWPDDRPVWTGSCPCQPFSAAGKRRGAQDERHLWPVFRDLIAERRPPIVFGEQVASPAGRDWLSGLRTDLEALAYVVGAADLCAAGVGAPQIRARLWWVADADNARWQRAVRQGQPHEARPQRTPARREPLRSDCRSWPPGPGAVADIPLSPDGIPGVMGKCRGYGNAIVPQVAAEFIGAYLDDCPLS